ALSRTRDPRPPRTSTLFPYTTLFRSHHLQFDLAHARFEHDAVVGQFSITFGGERLWRGVTDRDVHDLDAFVRQSVGIGRQVRDFADDLEPFDHPGENRVETVECRLLTDTDQKLSAAAFGLAG